MAKKVNVILLCDFPHAEDEGEVEAVGSVSYGYDGATYEADACEFHQKEVDETMRPLVASGRRTGSGTRRAAAPSAPASPKRTKEHREDRADMRRWLKDQGHKVSDRGRIPANLVAMYEAAH